MHGWNCRAAGGEGRCAHVHQKRCPGAKTKVPAPPPLVSLSKGSCRRRCVRETEMNRASRCTCQSVCSGTVCAVLLDPAAEHLAAEARTMSRRHLRPVSLVHHPRTPIRTAAQVLVIGKSLSIGASSSSEES